MNTRLRIRKRQETAAADWHDVHDELRFPLPFGSRVEVVRKDFSKEVYVFRGVDERGRLILNDPQGCRVLHALTLEYLSIHVSVATN